VPAAGNIGLRATPPAAATKTKAIALLQVGAVNRNRVGNSKPARSDSRKIIVLCSAGAVATGLEHFGIDWSKV
jgi:hypothetical protein